MGNSNQINYSLGGSGYALTNLLTNSGLNVCPKADSSIDVTETSKMQNPDFANPSGWILATNWSISGGVLNAVNATPSQFAQQIITGLTPYGNYRFTVADNATVDDWITSTVSDGRVITSKVSAGGNTSSVVAGVANAKGELTYRIHSPSTLLNKTFDNVTLTRKEPVFTNVNTDAPHGWQKLGLNFLTLTVDGALNTTQVNSISSLKMVSGASADTSDGLYYDISAPSFKKVLTFGCWVIQNVANSVQVGFSNDTLTVHSSVNSVVVGTDNTSYVWLETTVDNTLGTYSKVSVRVVLPNTTCYITQPMLVNGNSIGAGNYSKPNKEWIELETGNVTGIRWVKPALWGNWGRTELDVSLPFVSNGKIPGNICKTDVLASCQSVTGAAFFETKSFKGGDRHLIVSLNVGGDVVASSGICLVKSGGLNFEAPASSINSVDVIFKRICVFA